MGVGIQYHPCVTGQGTALINQHMLIAWLAQGHTKIRCRPTREIQNPWSPILVLTSSFPKFPSGSSLLCQHPGRRGRSCCGITSCRTRPLCIGSAMCNNFLLFLLCALPWAQHSLTGFYIPAELGKHKEKSLQNSFWCVISPELSDERNIVYIWF